MNHKTHREQPDMRVAVTVAATASMRLRRWRLIAGRAVWLLIFTTFLSSYAVTLPSYLIAIEHPAPNNLALSRGAVAGLVDVGIGLPTYAWMCLVILVVGLLVSVTSSLVLFWRRGDDWTALVVSLFVGIHPVGIAGIALYSGSISALTIGWLPISVISVMESTLQFCVMLLFPSGRFVPRWSWLLVVIMSISAASAAMQTSGFAAASLISLIYPPVLGAAVACMVYRYRNISTPVQRLQTKWIVVGLVVTPLGNLAFWLPLTFTPLGQTLYAPAAFLVYLLVQLVTPLAFFIAVQRYRLYGIDTIINRALVYGSLTAILAAVYAGTVIGAQTVLGAITRAVVPEQPFVLVVTTLLIAALLRPLRRWLQTVVDRRFYRHKYDVSRTLAAFSSTLRQETDVMALRERLLAVVEETMQPVHASLWLLADTGPTSRISGPGKRSARGETKAWPKPSTAAASTTE